MAAHQAPPSLGFSRQEYWSGLTFPSPTHACMLSLFSRVRLCATLWTVAHQAPLSLGLSRQEHWSGSPFPSPRDRPDPGIEPVSPALAGGLWAVSQQGCRPQFSSMLGRGPGRGRSGEPTSPPATPTAPPSKQPLPITHEHWQVQQFPRLQNHTPEDVVRPLKVFTR